VNALRATPRRPVAALLALLTVSVVPGCTSADPAISAGATPTEVVGDPPVGGPATPPAAPAGSDADDPARVDVVLTYGGVESSTGDVEVSGYAAVVEDEGRCILTLRRRGHEDVRVEAEAVPDVRTTACGLLAVPIDRLAPGEWQARLEYRSAQSTGQSAASAVTVP